MRRLNKLSASLAAGGVLLCGLVWAQDTAPSVKSRDEETFRADTRLVVLHATVVDKNGRLMTNLGQNAFRVFENNVEQPVKTFRREDVPVSLGMVIDNSGSMRDKRRRVEAAALSAIKASNREDEVTIVNFNDEAFDDSQGFTNNLRRLEEAISRLDSRGGTAMRDAISMTIDFVLKKGKRDKKVILVITDGNDTASTQTTLEKLVQKAHDSEMVMFFIGLLSEEDNREARKAKRAMETLAKATGGSAVFPASVEEVEEIALAIAHEIRNQYIIAYSPTNPQLDGSFRTIKVTANGPNRPVVRTRSGYYATPEPANRTQSASAASRP